VVSPQTLLACPRVSPEWELSTLAALMRPTAARRGTVEHRGGGQDPWPAGTDRHALDLLATVGDRLGVDLAAWGVQASPNGEFFLVGQVPAGSEVAGRAAAVVLSRAVPDHWWVLGRLFVRDGRFYRRRRGYRLELVAANDVHLPRDVRGKLRGLV
jgi:hypothetical protein